MIIASMILMMSSSCATYLAYDRVQQGGREQIACCELSGEFIVFVDSVVVIAQIVDVRGIDDLHDDVCILIDALHALVGENRIRVYECGYSR